MTRIKALILKEDVARGVLESPEARDARKFAGSRALCPYCGRRVSRYTREEADYVRRMGCGCPKSQEARRGG